MNLVICSRQEIEAAIPQEPAIAICIAYPQGRLHKVVPLGNFLAVHHVRFSDCDAEGTYCFLKEQPPKAIPMTRGQAIDILDFVEQWEERAETLYIGCYGGISRSAGIAAGLAAVFGWSDAPAYAPPRQPNAHCKSLIIREAMTRSRR